MKSRTKSKAFDTGFFGPSELLGPEVSDNEHHRGEEAEPDGDLEKDKDDQCNQDPADNGHHHRDFRRLQGNGVSLAFSEERQSTDKHHCHHQDQHQELNHEFLQNVAKVLHC